MRTVSEHLSGLESSLGRALCWAATWDMLRDAELPARDFVALVCSALPNETDVNLVTSVLRQVETAIDVYADPTWAPSGRQQFANTAIARLGPGPLQLAWARAFIWPAREAADLTRLQQWLAGEGVPSGLEVDAELRWHILLRLVALGALGESEIASEEQRDQTSSGAEFAATARALLPTAESKATAWRKLTGADENLPNWQQRALLDGFYHPSQLELTRPYIPRYFEAIGPFCATHDLQTAHAFVSGAYPGIHVEQSVVEASDRWIADESQPQSARRLVQEGRDGVLRALAARARDVAAGSRHQT
jgi:aminopeptidase N